jgi:hypothetical protein
MRRKGLRKNGELNRGVSDFADNGIRGCTCAGALIAETRKLGPVADLMAEDFKEDGDQKGENRCEHPIVQPQMSFNVRSEFCDFKIWGQTPNYRLMPERP